ncbi:MAG: hypothetical protein ACT4SY_01080 [Hyphomicrobiales bacterium]
MTASAVCVLFCCFLVVAKADARAACLSAQVGPLLPDNAKGVRTKWRFTSGNDARHSIQPDLVGLPLPQWMHALELAGANLAELNLDPREKLAPSDEVSQSQIDSYVAALGEPRDSWNPGQEQIVSLFESSLIPNYAYTIQFRDKVLLAFLLRLEALKKAGAIAGSLKFILHQRQWFRPGKSVRLQALRNNRVNDFAADMAGFIELARQNCVDHWIAGIRLGENFNQDMSLYLPILVDIARQVNQKTGGWLKTRLFVANGGGMGAQFDDIDRVSSDSGKPFDFFESIAQETGSFAFGYKWMQLARRDQKFITRIMGQSRCFKGKSCDTRSVADWQFYLEHSLGLGDLKKLIGANRTSDPWHANVVFVGDSSDALTNMVSESGGELAAEPELRALYRLWPQSGTPGWSGRIFMNGFTESSTSPRLRDDLKADIGMSLYFVDPAGKIIPLRKSMAYWNSWPDPPQ